MPCWGPRIYLTVLSVHDIWIPKWAKYFLPQDIMFVTPWLLPLDWFCWPLCDVVGETTKRTLHTQYSKECTILLKTYIQQMALWSFTLPNAVYILNTEWNLQFYWKINIYTRWKCGCSYCIEDTWSPFCHDSYTFSHL